MNTEFDIGDTVWYGSYPAPENGVITEILITKHKIQYKIDDKHYREIVAKTEKEAKIRTMKSDIETLKRYITHLEKELEELEKEK